MQDYLALISAVKGKKTPKKESSLSIEKVRRDVNFPSFRIMGEKKSAQRKSFLFEGQPETGRAAQKRRPYFSEELVDGHLSRAFHRPKKKGEDGSLRTKSLRG